MDGANTPSLFPWVNQCGDGTEWVARAVSPYAVPELYSVTGTAGNAVAMAQAQLNGYESWAGKSQRFGLTCWPLVGIGDGGGIPNINSSSLARLKRQRVSGERHARFALVAGGENVDAVS